MPVSCKDSSVFQGSLSRRDLRPQSQLLSSLPKLGDSYRDTSGRGSGRVVGREGVDGAPLLSLPVKRITAVLVVTGAGLLGVEESSARGGVTPLRTSRSSVPTPSLSRLRPRRPGHSCRGHGSSVPDRPDPSGRSSDRRQGPVESLSPDVF